MLIALLCIIGYLFIGFATVTALSCAGQGSFPGDQERYYRHTFTKTDKTLTLCLWFCVWVVWIIYFFYKYAFKYVAAGITHPVNGLLALSDRIVAKFCPNKKSDV